MCTMDAYHNSAADERSASLCQIIDSSPALIHTARPDGSIDFFNQTWLEFVGQALSNLLGWEWTAFIHPEDREMLVAKWRESVATGERFEETARVRRADGEYRWMLHTKVSRRDTGGNVVKWFGSSIDIEERKLAEEQLRRRSLEVERSELYLAEAQRLGHIGSWVFDPTGRFDFWSRELFHIFGLDPAKDSPTMEEYLSCVHPHDREFMVLLIKRMLAQSLGCDVTKRIVRPDGEVRYIRCVGVPAVENGTLKRIIGSAMDVTEHEVLTQELRRREAYLAEAQGLSHTGSFGWRPESGEIAWSDETYRIFEHDPEAKVTLGVMTERIHPEDRSLVLEIVEQAANGGSAIDSTHRLLFPDGRVKHVQVLARPLGMDGDNLEFAGAVVDITEAKRAEERIRQSEADLRQLIDAIPQQVVVFDSDWSPLFANQQDLDYTGLSQEEARSITAIDGIVHPDDLEHIQRAREGALREPAPVEIEARIRRKDGSYRWFLMRAQPLHGADGRVVRWYGTRTDIDERKRVEDHLREIRVKLSKASQIATVAELSASIAHELNQPLMAVLANAQAAKRWLAADPPNLVETNASVDRILRDARAADESMQHIRALFNQASFDKKEANIPDMVREAVRLIQEDPKKRECEIDSRFEDDFPKLSIDPIQIQQVLINLISNAIEAMEGSAIPPLVKVRAAVTDQNEILIQVIDNGPGVDDPEKIFDAFVTTKKTGMGIGLTVSRTIVDAHGGRLWAENHPGGGARFSVALPMSSQNPGSAGA